MLVKNARGTSGRKPRIGKSWRDYHSIATGVKSPKSKVGAHVRIVGGGQTVYIAATTRKRNGMKTPYNYTGKLVRVNS